MLNSSCKAAEASLRNLRVQTQNEYLQQQAAAASIGAELPEGEDAGRDERGAGETAARLQSRRAAVDD